MIRWSDWPAIGVGDVDWGEVLAWAELHGYELRRLRPVGAGVTVLGVGIAAEDVQAVFSEWLVAGAPGRGDG